LPGVVASSPSTLTAVAGGFEATAMPCVRPWTIVAQPAALSVRRSVAMAVNHAKRCSHL